MFLLTLNPWLLEIKEKMININNILFGLVCFVQLTELFIAILVFDIEEYSHYTFYYDIK